MSLGKILIRADASVEIGTGHVMRCLALAQAWQDQGGEAIFAMAQSTPAVAARLAAEHCEVISLEALSGSFEDANCTVELARNNGAKWIVADGYSFDASYHGRIKAAGLKLLCVDDNADATYFFGDLVLNQNLHACESLYQERERTTGLLLGPKFAMLRREFNAWRGWRRQIPPLARRLLVTMGGSDPRNLSALVIEALRPLQIDGLEINVLAGRSNPHIPSLRAAESRDKFRLEVDARNIPELMAWADLAVSSAGSTCWEMCMLGLPAIVIDVAENQTPLARELDHQGIALHVPLAQATIQRLAEKNELLVNSHHLRSNMSRRATELVDGQGAARVLAAMRAQEITIRRAQPKDCRLVWEWANDPVVRQASFSPSSISWEEHDRWFSQKLVDPAELLLIFEDESGTPLGTARFHSNTRTDAEISVTVAPHGRGKGLAPHLLEKAVERLFQSGTNVRVHAFIKTGNLASLKSFEDAGFFLMRTTQVKGNEALHYVRMRDSLASNASVTYQESSPERARCR